MAFARLTKAPLTLEVASQALTEFSTPGPRRSLSPLAIIDTVAKYFELEPEALEGKKRDKLTALARHVAVYLIREEIGRPFTEIGRQLGGRDHSAILRGYEKIAAEININPQLRRDILELRELLYSKSSA